jgi:toxin ParE1/3/4
MKVSWQEQALVDLDEALAYISEDNPTAALKRVAEILASADQMLSEHPFAGRQGRVEGTREIVMHKSYVLAYRVEPDNVQILSVVQSARLWPTGF